VRRQLEVQRGERLWVVHRLDRDASGVLVLARTAEAHRALSVAFEQRMVEKAYLAFVAGAPAAARGRIGLPLHAARRGKTRPAHPGEPGARAASTDYAVRHTWRRGAEAVSLVEARPLTGRQHQIRVHLRALGVPLLFDEVYGRGVALAGFEAAPARRLALHASRLVVPPGPGAQPLRLEAPLATDLEALRAWLDGWAS
jgi:tRNA pseudouridine32 synthase/23S rRNA pseudouridine746 synthase